MHVGCFVQIYDLTTGVTYGYFFKQGDIFTLFQDTMRPEYRVHGKSLSALCLPPLRPRTYEKEGMEKTAMNY